MATLTVYSDGEDGHVRSENATYATARSGSTLTLNSGAGPDDFAIGQRTGAEYLIYEGFLGFDTSSLTSGATVTAAVLSLYGEIDNTTTDFTIEARLFDWGATLATGDWIAGADLSAQTLLATFATSGFSIAGYNDFTDVALPANINKTGVTRMILDSSRHSGNNAPADNEYVWVWASEKTGTTNDPKLVVTYTGSVTVTPSAIAATASFPATSPSGAANVSPAPISASVTFPASVVSVAAGPQPIACVAALPQANLLFDYVVTPAVLAAIASFPRAGVAVAAGPPVISCSAGFPAAGVAIILTPGTIAVIASFPAATVTAIFSQIGSAVSTTSNAGKVVSTFPVSTVSSSASSVGSSTAKVLP